MNLLTFIGFFNIFVFYGVKYRFINDFCDRTGIMITIKNSANIELNFASF